VNTFFTAKFSRFFAVLCMLAFMGLLSEQATAASTDPRMFGPWVVQQAPMQENIGLRVYFSPDGNFFMVDAGTKLGLTGNWVIGRSGLLVSIYGNGKWARLWDADVSFEGNNKMIVDVKDSQVTLPQRFTLLRLKF
jgi:hypothetical protein